MADGKWLRAGVRADLGDHPFVRERVGVQIGAPARFDPQSSHFWQGVYIPEPHDSVFPHLQRL
jgi:hypothetical protein